MLKKIENDPHEKDARTPRAALLLCLNFWWQTTSYSRQKYIYIDQNYAIKSKHIRSRIGCVEYQDHFEVSSLKQTAITKKSRLESTAKLRLSIIVRKLNVIRFLNGNNLTVTLSKNLALFLTRR